MAGNDHFASAEVLAAYVGNKAREGILILNYSHPLRTFVAIPFEDDAGRTGESLTAVIGGYTISVDVRVFRNADEEEER